MSGLVSGLMADSTPPLRPGVLQALNIGNIGTLTHLIPTVLVVFIAYQLVGAIYSCKSSGPVDDL